MTPCRPFQSHLLSLPGMWGQDDSGQAQSGVTSAVIGWARATGSHADPCQGCPLPLLVMLSQDGSGQTQSRVTSATARWAEARGGGCFYVFLSLVGDVLLKSFSGKTMKCSIIVLNERTGPCPKFSVYIH